MQPEHIIFLLIRYFYGFFMGKIDTFVHIGKNICQHKTSNTS